MIKLVTQKKDGRYLDSILESNAGVGPAATGQHKTRAVQQSEKISRNFEHNLCRDEEKLQQKRKITN